MNGDYGISFDQDFGEQEEVADRFAEDMLIPCDQYQNFVAKGRFDAQSICEFSERINRDPGIVLGRLLNDGKVDYSNWSLNSLRHKYKVTMNES